MQIKPDQMYEELSTLEIVLCSVASFNYLGIVMIKMAYMNKYNTVMKPIYRQYEVTSLQCTDCGFTLSCS